MCFQFCVLGDDEKILTYFQRLLLCWLSVFARQSDPKLFFRTLIYMGNPINVTPCTCSKSIQTLIRLKASFNSWYYSLPSHTAAQPKLWEIVQVLVLVDLVVSFFEFWCFVRLCSLTVFLLKITTDSGNSGCSITIDLKYWKLRLIHAYWRLR